ncbi:MAG: class I SAM-dependent methyltransferase [Bacteroidia bacterium]|jgi:SAM-dependent methyltransferase|nr:class I SAM-dependent methyltransferase [Bacteroidia bacterium]
MNEWFGTWFDSEYYHLLYKDRNYTEAEAFMVQLSKYLKPTKDQLILDLACGKGRHSIQLNKLGANMEGCDYSLNSINYARKYDNATLTFYTHDMRDALPKQYDVILNLFTSFGYFDTDEEHQKTLQNIYDGLNQGGTFIFDFMNVDVIIPNLVSGEVKNKEGIEFHIKREVVDGRITKYIAFEDEQEEWHYHKEKVAVLDHNKLVNMMKSIGFKVVDTFGNYHLNAFDVKKSDRLILILRK